MEMRATARYAWDLRVVLSLSEDASRRLTNGVLTLADVEQRIHIWNGEVTHDAEKKTLTFQGTVYGADFKNIDQQISDVLYALGAAPNRVIVLSAMRGRRVTL